MLDVLIKALLYNNITHNAVNIVFISKSLSANKALKETWHTFPTTWALNLQCSGMFLAVQFKTTNSKPEYHSDCRSQARQRHSHHSSGMSNRDTALHSFLSAFEEQRGVLPNCLGFSPLRMMDCVWNACTELSNEASESTAPSWAAGDCKWNLSLWHTRPTCINSAEEVGESSATCQPLIF